MGDLTKNFDRSEFACKCGCGHDRIDLILVDRLQSLRDFYGEGIEIRSGCRCEIHNRNEGGKEDSAHLSGRAADLEIGNSHARFLILKGAIMVGFRRIGIGKTFVHLDIDITKPNEVSWVY